MSTRLEPEPTGPPCPICAEPVSGWEFDIMTGHHLTPCGHFVTSLVLAQVGQAAADILTAVSSDPHH